MAIAIWLGVVGMLIGCRRSPDPTGGAELVAWADEPAIYVGRESCRECHENAMRLFEGSHHDLAMDHATETTVLGDFEDSSFTYNDLTSRFYRRAGGYYVETEAGDGTLQEFSISYVFGVTPLQQYLIEFPDGRIQCLGIAWDSRPEEAGGQRWFHLYPDEKVDHRDVLHWTGVSQNWNYMCADCHSTNLHKNYDQLSDTYATTWSEVDVSCEACHGPASRHLAWAEAHRAGKAEVGVEGEMGLFNSLRDTGGGFWLYSAGEPIARRTALPDNDRLVETCARCHSLRTQLREYHPGGQPLLDDYELRLLDEGLYFPDGQILSEVYVYGSFRQSKMARAGVRCTDCHDPHSLQMKAPGNALCGSCHIPVNYDSPEHHFHPRESTGALCVECHMPSRNYMVVDPRQDHSFRIPRPDLTLTMGSPNACNICHTDKDAAWSLAASKEWYGEDWPRTSHYGEVLHAGREVAPGSADRLLGLAEDADQPGIVRATAISLLAGQPSPKMFNDLLIHHRDPDPLVRMATASASAGLGSVERLKVVMPLLDDPVLSVRMEAVSRLMDLPAYTMTAEQVAARERAFEEFIQVNKFSGDHPSARTTRGYFYLMRGDFQKAEQAYREAIELEPGFVPAYVNLADLYRQTGRDPDGEVLLRAGLEQGEVASLHHVLGLLLARAGRIEEAQTSLGRAAALEENDPRMAYVYAVALQSTGKLDQAIEVLGRALDLHPYDRDLLVAVISYLVEAGRFPEAQMRADELRVLEPNNRGVLELIRRSGLQTDR
jgi:Flp pilus assembly protein TadD